MVLVFLFFNDVTVYTLTLGLDLDFVFKSDPCPLLIASSALCIYCILTADSAVRLVFSFRNNLG